MKNLKFEFSVLGIYHPDTLYLRKQGSEDPWLFFEAKRGPRVIKLWKHLYRVYIFTRKEFYRQYIYIYIYIYLCINQTFIYEPLRPSMRDIPRKYRQFKIKPSV